MKRYESYKDSGVEWLGEVPASWNLTIGMNVFKENKRDNKGMKEKTVLSLSYGQIIIKPEEKLVGLVPESFETYQIVEPNDIIIRCTDLQNDKTSLRTGLAKDKGIITSAYLNLNVINGYSAKFMHYYLYALDITKILYKFGSGLRQNLSFLDFKRLPIIDISFSEQQKIAHYLDAKTTKIEQAISLTKKQIELLKEHKQILIQSAVTKGLDSDVAMKDSGVEWIEEVPSHWEVSSLGKILLPVSKKNRPDLPLLSITRELGVIKRNVEDLESNHNFIPDDLSNYKVLKKGQFGMNKMKAWQGSYGVSNFTGIVSPAYYIFDFIKSVNPVFFHWAIRSKIYVSFFGMASDGVRIGQWDLSKSRMKFIPFVIPSDEEQQKISQYLDDKTTKIDQAISLKQQHIEKLKEYKSVLINDVVTGKAKV
ncbi:restriction endonuclease subunit S [Rodentibacter sp. Ppn85]|uniref:restriction endonuclease subunit S n=1 Tax=Rodentibacter sp. Ppn85 TaxID=1908525 RepID=UPI0009873ABD|nr:restriction endonuclease subunit S [Rodentibacter sp. Ppn85]OOF64248.1 restriction endonuclease subunit S [Rodentibacter sp. Ppn85]